MEHSLAGFNGQRPDPVSRHYHLGNGYRACSPILGRFTAPDSWSPFGAGGLNPYTYCEGDPVNRADPSGHISLGQGTGMALGFVAGIALSIVTEGAAMPVVLTLMATVAGDAAVGAGAEFAAEALDGQRVNWSLVGMAAGLSAVASLAGFGVGRLSKLKGTSNRPFGGLMMDGASGSGTRRAAVQGPEFMPEFQHPRLLGVIHNETGYHLQLAYVDRVTAGERVNIVAEATANQFPLTIPVAEGRANGANALRSRVDALYPGNDFKVFRLLINGAGDRAGTHSSFGERFIARRLNEQQVALVSAGAVSWEGYPRRLIRGIESDLNNLEAARADIPYMQNILTSAFQRNATVEEGMRRFPITVMPESGEWRVYPSRYMYIPGYFD